MLSSEGDRFLTIFSLEKSVSRTIEEGNKKGIIVKLDLEKTYDKTIGNSLTTSWLGKALVFVGDHGFSNASPMPLLYHLECCHQGLFPGLTRPSTR